MWQVVDSGAVIDGMFRCLFTNGTFLQMLPTARPILCSLYL